MPKFGIEVSAYIEEGFDKKPTKEEVIKYFRDDIDMLLDNLDIDLIEKID